MNEKIKNLVEQCTTVEHGVIQPRSRGDVYHFDKEKFAELIVHECCEQLIKQGNDWEQFSRNPAPGQENNAYAALFAAYRLKEDAVFELKEHFGIK